MGTSPGRSRGARTRYVRNGAQTELPILMEVLDAIPVMGIDWDADRALTELYSTHYRSLVRLAALLIHDIATAEEVVQDSFVAMHSGWKRLCDSDKALAYLQQSVVNRSRSVLRHRVVAERTAPEPPADMPNAEHGAMAALRALPPRQREALVLRYYGDMSEAQIVSVMGLGRGSVKTHAASAMSALRSILEAEA